MKEIHPKSGSCNSEKKLEVGCQEEALRVQVKSLSSLQSLLMIRFVFRASAIPHEGLRHFRAWGWRCPCAQPLDMKCQCGVISPTSAVKGRGLNRAESKDTKGLIFEAQGLHAGMRQERRKEDVI